MKIIEKTLLELTEVERRQCRSLSARKKGLMCDDLTRWRKVERIYEGVKRGNRRVPRVWLIKDDDGMLLSWAMITPVYQGRGYDAQFYTRKSHRGKGYGSQLMRQVLMVVKDPYVFPHDKMSGDFFKKHRNSIRYDKQDQRWLDE